MQGAKLEAAQARAEAVGDEREVRVADALGAAVALERELGDGQGRARGGGVRRPRRRASGG